MATGGVPLAWLNLVHDKRRCAVSVAGVAFAVLLMFMQTGFRNALLDSTVAVIEALDADLVVISKSKYCLAGLSPFSRRRLEQALEVPGVRSATPFYIEFRTTIWKNPDDRSSTPRPIRVLAFDPAQPALVVPEVLDQLDRLQQPDVALMDSRSKQAYGPARAGLERELSGKVLHVAGTFHLGTDFTSDGNLVMSDRNFARYCGLGSPDSTLARPEVGLIKLQTNAEPAEVLASLQQALGDNDVAVITKSEFAAREREFWQRHTPVGFVFGLGTVIGFVVGLVICYQILATDVADHLQEFATLKAIGYTDGYLTGLVFKEAVWLSLCGFVPGLLAALALYALLEWRTGLPLYLNVGRAGFVLFLTVLLCVLSGALALRKVRSADPAEVF
jgi:putative ABC transport system permease protein